MWGRGNLSPHIRLSGFLSDWDAEGFLPVILGIMRNPVDGDPRAEDIRFGLLTLFSFLHMRSLLLSRE